jgi:hypothetical protein
MIIYSCITNGYDEIPDDHYYDPDVRYVMFHDGTVEKKGPWEFIDIRDYNLDIKNKRDIALYPKINPYVFFERGEDTVWIDGCYIMTKEFVELSKENLDKFDISILEHFKKFSYCEEILEGFMCAWYSEEEVLHVTQYLETLGYNFRKYRSPMCAIIWRKLSDEVIEHSKLWWKLIFAKKDYMPCRDQVGFDASLQLLDLQSNIIHVKKCGINLLNRNSRRKKLPQVENKEQYKKVFELSNKLRTYTKIHPFFYQKGILKLIKGTYMQYYGIHETRETRELYPGRIDK